MAQIIQFTTYRADREVRECFRSWQRRFNETFDSDTRLYDISGSTLCGLAEPGESSSELFYTLIISLLRGGQNLSFELLDKNAQMRIIDIHLFLSDQIRFEMMRRLNWLSDLPVSQFSIVEMVIKYNDVRQFCQLHQPVLAGTHPQYKEYQRLVPRDQQVFIRQLLPLALEAFQEHSNGPA